MRVLDPLYRCGNCLPLWIFRWGYLYRTALLIHQETRHGLQANKDFILTKTGTPCLVQDPRWIFEEAGICRA